MIFHTQLDGADMWQAARKAGVDFHRLARRGSKSRARAFDLILEGSSNRRGSWGKPGGPADYQAATWDEWGIFLGELFDRDPAARCTYYNSRDHYRWVTGGRFDALTPAAQHANHRWGPAGDVCTGTYSAQECACGAVRRWLTHGHAFAELVGAR
jgi:hypothetical protein